MPMPLPVSSDEPEPRHHGAEEEERGGLGHGCRKRLGAGREKESITRRHREVQGADEEIVDGERARPRVEPGEWYGRRSIDRCWWHHLADQTAVDPRGERQARKPDRASRVLVLAIEARESRHPVQRDEG